MIIGGIILYVVLLIIMILINKSKEGYYSTITVFGISGFIFYLGIPLEAVITNRMLKIGAFSPFILDSHIIKKIVFISLYALLSFFAGYFISGLNPHDGSDIRIGTSGTKNRSVLMPVSLIAVLVTSALVLITLFSEKFYSVGNYCNNVLTTYTSPVYSYLVGILCYFGSIFVAYHILSVCGFRLLNLSIMAILVIWGVYSSNKNPILLAFLGAASYFCLEKGKGNFSKLVLPFLGAILFLASFPLFSLYRTGLKGSELFSEYYFSMTNIDPAGPYYSLIYVLNSEERLFGLTYINDLLLIVPKWIWLSRPAGTAEAFAQKIIPNWMPGNGLGYSLLAEAYQNFGIIGSFLQYFFIGLVWGLTWKTLKRKFFKFNTLYFKSLYFTVGYYFLILIHRGPTIGLIKNMVHFLSLFLIGHLLSYRYYIINGKLFRIEKKRN